MKKLFSVFILSLVLTQMALAEGVTAIRKVVNVNGEVRYIADALACGAYPAIAPKVEKLSEDKVLITLEVYTKSCASHGKERAVSFLLGDFEYQILDLGLNPAQVTLFFNLGGIVN